MHGLTLYLRRTGVEGRRLSERLAGNAKRGASGPRPPNGPGHPAQQLRRGASARTPLRLPFQKHDAAGASLRAAAARPDRSYRAVSASRCADQRVRSLTEGELSLSSFEWAANCDALDAATMAAIAAGVPTRRYAGTQEPVPEARKPRAGSKRAVSRRFVQLSQEQPAQCLARPLGDLWSGLVEVLAGASRGARLRGDRRRVAGHSRYAEQL